MRAVGRDGGAVNRVSGAIMPSTIGWKRSVFPPSGRVEAVRQMARHPKGPTATPTAAVVCALLTPVMLVQFAMDQTISLQVHGIQDDHLIV